MVFVEETDCVICAVANAFLEAFAKFRKATVSFAMSARVEELGCR
jgi:hypothetical protein